MEFYRETKTIDRVSYMNTASLFRKTPLLEACENNNVELVKLLLKNGNLDINQGNRFFPCPLHCAIYDNYNEIAEILIKDQRLNINELTLEEDNYLQYACSCGNYNIVKILLSNKLIDINHKNIEGDTALHILSEYNTDNYVNCLKLLFSFDRYLIMDIKNNNNETALDIGIKSNSTKIIDIFNQYQKNKEGISEEFRKEFDLKNLNKNEKFLYACSDGNLILIKIFLKMKISK